MFSQYKWYIYIAVFLAYTIGVWHFSSTHTNAKYLKARVDLQDKYIKDTQELQLKLDTERVNRQAKTKIIQREIVREVEKPVYHDCATTPDGVRIIEQSIDNSNGKMSSH